MVYETDFYTTRRPYRATPSLSTYTITKREIPWEKVPFVPRPSLVPDPVTAFGKRRTEKLKPFDPLFKAQIKPKVLVDPPKPYISARETTRQKVYKIIDRDRVLEPDNIDVALAKVHKVSEMQNLPYKRKLIMASQLY